MNLAKELGRTCHESYIRSSTGLGPEMFYFTNDNEAKARYSLLFYFEFSVSMIKSICFSKMVK